MTLLAPAMSNCLGSTAFLLVPTPRVADPGAYGVRCLRKLSIGLLLRQPETSQWVNLQAVEARLVSIRRVTGLIVLSQPESS